MGDILKASEPEITKKAKQKIKAKKLKRNDSDDDASMSESEEDEEEMYGKEAKLWETVKIQQTNKRMNGIVAN